MTPDESLKVPELFRDCEVSEIAIRRDGNLTRLTFPASSERPVPRFFGNEVLQHTPGAIRLQRATSGAMPLLFNHDTADIIGMVDAARVESSRLIVDAHLFETQRAQEVGAMISGGLRNVSIGYRLHTLEEDKKSDVFRATDWEPYEASIVGVPADPSVGLGRNSEVFEVRMIRTVAQQPAKEQQMDQQSVTPGGSAAPDIQTGPDNVERLRITAIMNLCRQNYGEYKPSDDDRDRWIQEGAEANDVSKEILAQIAERAKHAVKRSPANAGMTAKDVQQYSITRAIKACVEKSWPKVAPYEAELSNQVARNLGKQSGEHTFFVPLEAQWAAAMQRDQVVATASSGGYLVGTNVVSFIELLRNRSVVMSLGATTMPGLVGSVAIPKQLTAATAYWFATEAGTATESNLTFGQLALSPKTVGGYVEISRQLLLQSTPNAEGIVNADLARVLALAIDSAALAGPGTAGQPTGIIATTGVGTANPGTGTAISYADVIKFQTTVAASNAMLPGFAYVTTPTIAGIYMAKPRFTNSDTPIWGGNILDGTLVGARAMTSLQVGSGTMLGGDFSQVVIGEWGVLEIETNPYAQFQAGIVGVRALYSVDIGIRYGAAFAMGSGMIS